jgi:hypothetical protein
MIGRRTTNDLCSKIASSGNDQKIKHRVRGQLAADNWQLTTGN